MERMKTGKGHRPVCHLEMVATPGRGGRIRWGECVVIFSPFFFLFLFFSGRA